MWEKGSIIGLVMISLIGSATLFLSITKLTVTAANNTETLTLNPIAWKCVSNTGLRPPDLVVCFDREKNEWISYLAFNLSEIPSWVSIVYATFKIKSQFINESTRISAYCSSDAEWLGSTLTWMNKPELNQYLGDQWVSTFEKWYSWNYSTLEIYGCALIDIILSALEETSILTIQLRSGLLAYVDHKDIIRIRQFGNVIFYSDAQLEISYLMTPPIIDSIDVSPPIGKSGTIFVVSAYVNDLSGISRVIAYIQKPDETNIDEVILTDPDGDQTYVGEWNSIDADDGIHYIDIIANDTLNNQNEKESTSTFRIDNFSPSISDVSHQPLDPTPDHKVIVTCSVTDEFGVKKVCLCFSVDEGVSWNRVLASYTENFIYEATIPKQSENITVQYYFEAYDNASNSIESSIYSYTVKSKEVPFWTMVVASFIVFGLLVITVVGIIRFVRKRRHKMRAYKELIHADIN